MAVPQEFGSSPESVGKKCGFKARLGFSKRGGGRPFSPLRRIASGVKAMRRRGERGSGRSLEVQKTGLP